MTDTARARTRRDVTSAFVAGVVWQGAQVDTWSETGRAIELAHREPARIGFAVRLAIGIAVAVTAKLYAAIAVSMAVKFCAMGTLP